MLEDIIKGWGRMASSSDAFGLLRVLNCRSQKDITARVFAHLNNFSALSQFNVEDCALGPKHRQAARDHGWNYRRGKELSDLLRKGGATGTGWDSIVHASFQLGGGFSERMLKEEGREAFDAIPVLHMSVGATQPDALVDMKGDRSLRSFYRECVDTIRFAKKSPLSRTLASSAEMSCNKPTLRASKQQNMADFLTGFGGLS